MYEVTKLVLTHLIKSQKSMSRSITLKWNAANTGTAHADFMSRKRFLYARQIPLTKDPQCFFVVNFNKPFNKQSNRDVYCSFIMGLLSET